MGGQNKQTKTQPINQERNKQTKQLNNQPTNQPAPFHFDTLPLHLKESAYCIPKVMVAQVVKLVVKPISPSDQYCYAKNWSQADGDKPQNWLG